MTTNMGISAGTVEDVAKAIAEEIAKCYPEKASPEPCNFDRVCSQAAITALLASGEAVLRKDVEELVKYAARKAYNEKEAEEKLAAIRKLEAL